MNILASADLVIVDECSLEARVIFSLKAVRFDPLLIRNDLRTKSEKTPNMGVGEKYPSYVLLCCVSCHASSCHSSHRFLQRIDHHSESVLLPMGKSCKVESLEVPAGSAMARA